MLAVGAVLIMINLVVLMLPVLTFSSPKSERRHAMEYNTAFNAGTASLYYGTKN